MDNKKEEQNKTMTKITNLSEGSVNSVNFGGENYTCTNEIISG